MSVIKDKYIPIFKAGIHTDSNGKTKTWTKQDLIKIKESTEKSGTFPHVIGHVKDNKPAWGWNDSALRIKGDVLYAKTENAIPEFENWLKKGLYKKRSVSIRPDMSVRHIAWLGAKAPAIKDLPNEYLEYSEDLNNDTVVEFSEEDVVRNQNWKFQDVAGLFQSLRDFLLLKEKDIETVNNILPAWRINNIEEKMELPEKVKNFSEKNKKGDNMPEPDKIDYSKLAAEMLKQQEEAKKTSQKGEDGAKKDEEVKKLADENKKLKKTQKQKEFSEFLEKNVKKIPAGLRSDFSDFMEILDEKGEDFDFSENDEKKPKSAIERFKKAIESLPDVVEFGEKYKTKQKDEGAETSDFSESEKEAKSLAEKYNKMKKKGGK